MNARPSIQRRLAALAAMAIVVVVLLWTVLLVVDRPGRLLIVLVLLAAMAASAWFAITRAGRARTIGTLLGLAFAAAVIAFLVSGNVLDVLARVGLLVVAVGLARYALGTTLGTLRRGTTKGTRVPAARRGVLIMNLKSGGGKAERFRLEDECRARGIEPVVLRPGNDLLDLARAAIDGGADVIGMAGGDGSQALVASVAAERNVPFVLVPAGTRNHLALDLGVDRNDVVGALDAFGEAYERRMDLAEVNGRVFVNNVSIGLYATIVRSPEYRDAKRETTLAALPQVLGPQSTPFDLRFDGPDGHHDHAHLIQVSNGPYGTTLRTLGSRPSLDDGLLGITALVIPDDASAARFLGALSTGRPDRYRGYQSWASTDFAIDSAAPIPIGLDGEAIELEPPLRFSIRPGVLRVRLAKNAIGSSPASRAVGIRRFLPDLWRVARGQPVR